MTMRSCWRLREHSRLKYREVPRLFVDHRISLAVSTPCRIFAGSRSLRYISPRIDWKPCCPPHPLRTMYSLVVIWPLIRETIATCSWAKSVLALHQHTHRVVSGFIDASYAGGSGPWIRGAIDTKWFLNHVLTSAPPASHGSPSSLHPLVQ